MTAAQKIKAQNSIIDIARTLGLEVKSDSGNKMICLCPFCEDKSGHLYLYRDTNRFHCHRCQKHGDLIDLYGLTKGLPLKTAINELSGGKPSQDTNKSRPLQIQRIRGHIDDMFVSPPPKKDFRQLYFDALFYAQLTEKGLNYLHGRGLSDKIIKRYSLGSIDDPTGLSKALRDNYDIYTLIEAGLFDYSKNGKPYFVFYLPAIIFPHTDLEITKFTSLSTRNLAGDAKCFKLHNQPSRLFYGQIDNHREIYIFEGIITALSYAELTGKDNFIALAGQITPAKYEKLERQFPNHRLILGLDPDKAGEKALAEIRRCEYINWLELYHQMGLKTIPTGADGKTWDLNDLLMYSKGLKDENA
jgi:DNA primase